MQRQTEQHPDWMSLPIDLWVMIFKMIPNSEIKKRSMVTISKKHHRLIAQHILHSFYGRSLNFKSWQQEYLKKLRAKEKEFNDAYTVSIFNQPQHGSRFNLSHRILMYVFMGCIAAYTYYLTLSYLNNKRVQDYALISAENSKKIIAAKQNIDKMLSQYTEEFLNQIPQFVSTRNNLRALESSTDSLGKELDFLAVTYKSIIIIALTLLTASLIYFLYKSHQARTQNTFFRQQPISQEVSNDFIQLANELSIVIPNFVTRNNIQPLVTQLSTLSTLLNNELSSTENYAKRLDNYLEQKRLSYTGQQLLEENDLSNLNNQPEVKAYAQRILTFWSRSHKEDALLQTSPSLT